ncbi:Mature-T-Cell Proliferation I type [Parasponia andersonii]|uniref:Mature-T-Cell Proliferation I type n=2 Tax=fabids TaxID=91835 RepID=A0A2P5BJ19_PARAD|nr:Mature-T-Cell Proliferation I type [Parasponia andersonii]
MRYDHATWRSRGSVRRKFGCRFSSDMYNLPQSQRQRQRPKSGTKNRILREMAQQSKEPCKKEACDIQACLSKNNFLPQKCVTVIQKLQSCCEKSDYNSTHCASVAGLLKQISN